MPGAVDAAPGEDGVRAQPAGRERPRNHPARSDRHAEKKKVLARRCAADAEAATDLHLAVALALVEVSQLGQVVG